MQNFNLKQFAKSRHARHIIYVLMVLALMLVSFQVGNEMGRRRAEFSGRLGENYVRMFGTRQGGPRGMIGGGFSAPNMPIRYGATGKVLSIGDGSFVVAGPDNVEKIIRVSSTTMVRELQNTASATDIKENDSVIVIGFPNSNGEVMAKFIRILPSLQK